MKVAVFGGSQPQEGSTAFVKAQLLGGALARRGPVVVTGGYTGIMEAVSRGAAEAGGRVIDITCDEIARFHGRSPNAWVLEEQRCATLMDRLQGLIRGSDAPIALPGGPGTLTEIALTWNLMIVGSLERRPLIIVGIGWRTVWDVLYEQLGDYAPQSQRGYLSLAETPADALDLLHSMAS